ncbi:hypothetical protein D3C77_312110 [compost metagenome]
MHMKYVTLLPLRGNPAQLQRRQFRVGAAVREDERFFSVRVIIYKAVILLLRQLQMLGLTLIPGIREREMLH